MWYQVVQYLKFLWRSTNQHGVHSPFVYQLATQCFYDKTKHSNYKILKQYRNQLLTNSNSISVTDFGAGSHIFKSNNRKISSIAKHAGITKKRAQLLYRIARYFKPKSILELGTSLGLGASALYLGHSKTKLITIEGCKATAQIAEQQLKSFNLNAIDLRINVFKEELKNLNNQSFDFIYIDGHHNKKATLLYFKTLLNNIHNDSLMIFDDIYWSKDMTEAWEVIKQHPKVTVTIDTFQWGIVFFRKEQVKEHFTIRV